VKNQTGDTKGRGGVEYGQRSNVGRPTVQAVRGGGKKAVEKKSLGVRKTLRPPTTNGKGKGEEKKKADKMPRNSSAGMLKETIGEKGGGKGGVRSNLRGDRGLTRASRLELPQRRGERKLDKGAV